MRQLLMSADILAVVSVLLYLLAAAGRRVLIRAYERVPDFRLKMIARGEDPRRWPMPNWIWISAVVGTCWLIGLLLARW